MYIVNRFRKLAHLEEQIGPRRFDKILLNPEFTGRIRRCLDDILEGPLSDLITVGGRTYAVLCFLNDDEVACSGDEMSSRLKQGRLTIGKSSAQHFLGNNSEIPSVFQDRVVFVIPNWESKKSSERFVACFEWADKAWSLTWRCLEHGTFDGRYRALGLCLG